MVKYRKIIQRLLLILFVAAVNISAVSQAVRTSFNGNNGSGVFRMTNENLHLSVVIREHQLIGDTLSGNPLWLKTNGSNPFDLWTDADFDLNFVWTDWQAPKKSSNADNPVLLDKTDFLFTGHSIKTMDNGSSELCLSFKGSDLPILLNITYHLDPQAFYVKRKIAVRDTTQGVHFLDKMIPRKGYVAGFEPGGIVPATARILKKGEFGQPCALQFGSTGCFFGVEYPASSNILTETKNGTELSCSQDEGEKVGKEPVASDWVVEALVPTIFVRDWFFRYVDDIRVAPARPFSLYNSWYDLRSPEYPKVKPGNVMNEENVLSIIRLFKKNMIDKYHISLDAFVLDDGWDVYQSDWLLRKETFPHGLKPVSDTLKKLGTSLGLWFGPTGGYSFRMKRVNWMKDHGYEVVGTGRDYAMLCLGGKNYSSLFRKRITDFVANEGVSYFKWDGIQFSCSEAGHGHPIGIYSRKAILDSLIDKCKAVRAINPSTYLNITSGTWLSPWWVKYANQIWMQGEDYGYADVPSISERDGAMTYKDFVLYDDLTKKDWWFPVSNLMTHGIIKGNLETLGGEDDPLDKFTNDVVFYLGRGVSMYELYISPDLLTEQEWNAEGSSIAWAKDRFSILSNTFMTGGDPTRREPYGYVHFKGNRGILSIRNPFITPSVIKVQLSPEYGLAPGSTSLVLDKIYPYRWISGQLYATGSVVEIPLQGYETAVFEVYPLASATEPLPAGARFDFEGSSGNDYKIRVYDAPLGIRLLNPDFVKNPDRVNNIQQKSAPDNDTMTTPAILSHSKTLIRPDKNGTELSTKLRMGESVKQIRYAILLKPDKDTIGRDFPEISFEADGKEMKTFVEQQKGLWSWYSWISDAPVTEIKAIIKPKNKNTSWQGRIATYAICRQFRQGEEITFSTTVPASVKPMLPSPFPPGISETITLLDEFNISLPAKH